MPAGMFNPLPDMPISGFSNSVANKDIVTKIFCPRIDDSHCDMINSSLTTVH